MHTVSMARKIASAGRAVWKRHRTHLQICRNRVGKHPGGCRRIRRNRTEDVCVSTLSEGAGCLLLTPHRVSLLPSFRSSFPKNTETAPELCMLGLQGMVLCLWDNRGLKRLSRPEVTCTDKLAQFPYIGHCSGRLGSHVIPILLY